MTVPGCVVGVSGGAGARVGASPAGRRVSLVTSRGKAVILFYRDTLALYSVIGLFVGIYILFLLFVYSHNCCICIRQGLR